MKSLTIQCFQHVPYESAGSIEDWCDEHGHQFVYTRLYQNEKPLPDSDYDWLIIMGGPMSVHDDHIFPWMKGEKEAIGQAIKAGKKILGICLGSQLIAQVLGAKVFKNPVEEIGWHNISFTDAALKIFSLGESKKQMKIFHWHGDTFSLAENTILLASSKACANQAYIFGNHTLAIQFHPEVKPENIDLMVQHGHEELTNGKYVQSADEIVREQQYFEQSKLLMFHILDWFGHKA